MNEQQPGVPIISVIFRAGEWHTVAKSYDGPGIFMPANGRPGYKDQVLLTLVDGRRMYVPPEIDRLITELRIKRGEPFRIGRHEQRNGQRRGVEFEVQCIAPAQSKSPQRAAIPVRRKTQTEEETPLARKLKASIDAVNSRKTNKEPAPLWPDTDQRPTPQQPQPTKTAAAAVSSPTVPMPRTANGTQNGSTTPQKIPMDAAFEECVAIVVRTLKKAGEQWTDEAKQGAVSTLLIGAQREGWLLPWDRKQAS
jgi:hypothetical protein